MEKTIKLFATLRDLTGKKTLTVPFQDGQSVRDLLRDVEQLEPELHAKMVNEDDELTGLVHILVHGRNVEWLEGMDTIITERDILTFLPPSAGG